MNNKKRFYVYVFFIAILIFSNSLIAFADNIPMPSKEFYVFDETNIINSDVEDYIIKTNEVLFMKTGAQVVVATVNSLNDMDIKEYANRVYEKWGIGSSEYDNGVLIFIAPNEREIWIEVGYGLEGTLPDGKVGKIIDDYIIPYFREENFEEGIIRGFNAIINSIEEEYNIDLEREKISENYYSNQNEEEAGVSTLFDGVKKILIIVGIIIFLFIDFRFFNGWLTFSILRGMRFGGGGYNDDHSNKGGGGSSGGGGAGGRW